jgi:tetratricopeptide (TPR) repeat protein
MRRLDRSAPAGSRCRNVFAAALLACVALGGCSPGDPLETARQRQARGDFTGSIEPLREVLAGNPEHPEANFLYGRALARTEPNLSVWALSKAMQDPEWLVPAGLHLALLALTAEDFYDVEQVTGRILEHEPDNLKALMYRANGRAHSKRNPEGALEDAKRILEIDPEATEAYEPMILALLTLGRLDEARDKLAEAGRLAVELGRGDEVLAWHCVTTAMFEVESGLLEQAHETWLRCLDAYPTDPDVVTSAVEFYDARGERERALEVLRTARDADPTSRDLRNLLAARLSASGQIAEGEAVLREATGAEDPDAATLAWVDLAKFRLVLEEYGPAADAFEQAVRLQKEAVEPSAQLLFEYADALVLADRLDAAWEIAEELSLPAHRHLIRARVAQERGDPAGALEEFDEVLRLWPNNALARYYAARAAEALGNFKRAAEELRNAIRDDPAAADARTRYASLLLAEGDPVSALKVLQIAVDPAPLDPEGLMLAMRLSGTQGDNAKVAAYLETIQQSYPAWVGQGLAEAAEGLNRRGGPALAVSMLTTAPGIDFGHPRFVGALRALVRFANLAGASDEAKTAFEKVFAAHPDSSAFQAIRGLHLELSGAPPEAAREAYERALELAPANPWALAGLGRLSAAADPKAALDYFDRAAQADPKDPELKLAAAKTLVALGETDKAKQRLDALLLEHPYEAGAAAERARLDLEQGTVTPQTLERARRAVRFGGGADALDLLSRVHAQREEPELAARAAEAAKALREAKPAEG